MSEDPTRYYFNIVTPSGIVSDEEGTELASLSAARTEAIIDARHFMSAAILQGWDISSRSIQISNDARDVLMKVVLREAITETDLPG